MISFKDVISTYIKWEKGMAEPEIKILVVDDDEVDREMIRKSLKALEATIVEAKDGAECIKLLTEQQFGLILLDYKLPDYDGLALISEVKRIVPTTPVVVVTGFGNEDLVRATALAGVLDYIPKNKVTPEFLTRTILNDLMIHKSQVEKERAEAELERHRKRDIELLTQIIAMAKEKIGEYGDSSQN